MRWASRIYWVSVVLVSAAVTGYLFYIDDWEEKHAPGYQSNDSVLVIVSTFVIYIGIIGAIISGITYPLIRFFLKKHNKR